MPDLETGESANSSFERLLQKTHALGKEVLSQWAGEVDRAARFPRESIDTIVRAQQIPADQQQIAKVLLTAARPKPPARWQVAPEVERRQQVEGQVQQIGFAVFNYATQFNPKVVRYDRAARHWGVVRPACGSTGAVL